MTRAIIHRTPGLLDIQAVTVMGLSAKPNSTSPIGQFGTGLKYALATLIRLGAEPRIFIGRDEYVFRTKKGTFRGAELDRIIMRRRRFGLTGWHTVELPYTTNYGKFWEPWMAFRELHSNTLDEDGQTFLATDDPDANFGEGVWAMVDDWGLPDHTTIVIENEAYVEAWEKRDEVFLPIDRLTEAGQWAGFIRAFEGESQHAYYRGLRALNLSKPSVVTWCIDTQTSLTEDRFVPEFWLRHYAGLMVAQSDDEALIERILTVDDGYWEHGLEMPAHVAPSPALRRVVARRPRGLSSRAYGYVASHTPTDYSRRSAWDEHGRPWHVRSTEAGEPALLDVSGRELAVPAGKFPADRWREMMQSACLRVNRSDELSLPEEIPPEMRRAYEARFGQTEAERDQAIVPSLDDLWSLLRMASRTHGAEPLHEYQEETCPGHVASAHDARVCGRCGTHIDSLRPDDEEEEVLF